MGILYNEDKIVFEAVIYEDEVISLREKLTELSPEKVIFDLTNCNDIHLSVIQQMLAYKKLYECDFEFPNSKKTFQMVIEGFDSGDCSV